VLLAVGVAVDLSGARHARLLMRRGSDALALAVQVLNAFRAGDTIRIQQNSTERMTLTPDEFVALVSAVKWPTAVVVTLAIFWRPLADLLRGFRNRSLTYKDTQIGAEQQAQTTLPEPSPTPSPALPAPSEPASLPTPVGANQTGTFLFEAEDNPYVSEIAALIRQNVDSKSFASTEERNRWLYREGAKLEIRVEFERLYRTLFQSQVATLLAANNALTAGGIGHEVVVQIYQETSKRYEDFYKTYPLESWLRYLTSNSLLVQNGTQWAITNKGQLYLQFLVLSGYGMRANVSF
jgi:hypothetical protein